MPINTGAVGIRPVTTERPLREQEGVQRRDEGTVAGFRPQTNVALRTAISDLAGTLERIATAEKLGMTKIPNEIGQIVKNILEQALSLQETLGKGVGSTIESQLFSMEQLSTFGRMLFQLGSLSDRGFSMKISPEIQTLLSQFKNFLVSAEGGNALEPVLMTKFSFELLDSKIPDQLPPALYEILSQLSQPLSQANQQPQGESDVMNFLNKLVKFFMPRPAADNAQPQQNFQQQQPMNQQQPQQNFQQPMNQQQPFQQNFQQPMNQQQPQQNFQQPMNQQQPQQNFQPMNQQQPFQQNFQQPMNQQQQPFQQTQQNFQQPMNQQQQPFQQTQQNFQQPMNQQQPFQQNFQQPMNQQQPFQQNFQQPTNQQQPQQNFQQPMNQQQPQQNFQQPTNQQQTQQNFQQPMNQQQPQQNFQQPMNQQQPFQQQNFQQPMNQQQPFQQQNFQQPMNQQQPFQQNNYQQPMNQQQPFQQQNLRQPTNQQQPQQNLQQPNQQQPFQQNNFQQPMNQQQPFQQNNFQQPMNQQQPFQQQNNFQQPTNQQQPFQQQNFQQPMNQQQPFQQNFQQPMNQQQPQQNFQQPMNQQQNFQQPTSTEELMAQQQSVRQQMKDAHAQIMRQPLENSPRTLDTMKNLARFLLQNTAMNPQDAATLQNFVNNPQRTFSLLENRHLQNLLRLCQQNVPATVRQAAVQQNLPDLPRLWAFMQLCDMAKLPMNYKGRQFRSAGKDIWEFSNSLRKSMSGDNFTAPVQNQRSFQMMVPIYLNVNEMSYPTYLNVYDESTRDNETGQERKETWVRICVLTDNIGAAELTFRIYEGNQLDMRFYFSQGETAAEFSTYVDELRNSLDDLKLQLGEIRIGNIGSTMEQY